MQSSYLHRITGTKRSWLPEPDPEDFELSAKRRKNDERHQSRWSSIIDRYSRDFSAVGDEIDLVTGEVVVDKGHLSGMRNEFDNGLSSQFLSSSDLLERVGEGFEDEDEDEDGEEEEEELEESEGEEDELSSNWPMSSPHARRQTTALPRSRHTTPLAQERHVSPTAELKEESSPPEEHRREASASLGDDEDSLPYEDAASEQDEPLPTREQTENIPAQPAAPTLPTFQMSQMGFGGQLEGAMAAMSTAMGAAIQAQMMAFMNVVMAAQQNGGQMPAMLAPAVPAIEAPQAAAAAPAQSNISMAPPPRPRKSGNGTTIPLVTSPKQRRSMLSPRDKAIRAQTPGYGSLWAAAPRERPRKVTSKQSSKPQPPPKRRAEIYQTPELQDDFEDTPEPQQEIEETPAPEPEMQHRREIEETPAPEPQIRRHREIRPRIVETPDVRGSTEPAPAPAKAATATRPASGRGGARPGAGRPKRSSAEKAKTAIAKTAIVEAAALSRATSIDLGHESENYADQDFFDVGGDMISETPSPPPVQQPAATKPKSPASKSALQKPPVRKPISRLNDRHPADTSDMGQVIAEMEASRAGSSPNAPFVIDSDEDELDTLTPTGSQTRKTASPPKPQVFKPVVEISTPTPAMQHRPQQPNTAPIARMVASPALAPSRPTRAAPVSYNEQETFTAIMGNFDGQQGRITFNEPKKWTMYTPQPEFQPRPQPVSRPQPTFRVRPQSRDELRDETPFELVDYQLPPNFPPQHNLAPRPAPRPGANAAPTAPPAPQRTDPKPAEKTAEYVYKPRPHLHKHKIPPPLTPSTGFGLIQPVQPRPRPQPSVPANTSLPRSHAKLSDLGSTAAQQLAAMTDEELEARHARMRNHRHAITTYDERPPPMPCAHCKATTATAWSLNPEGGHRRLCNACESYQKRHAGEKRPITLEEFRNLIDKKPCENCLKMTVAGWRNIIGEKRLCRPCGRWAQLHDGKMKPVPPAVLFECERCDGKVNQVFVLSNRAKVCVDCHNHLFSDYDPRNDRYGMTTAAPVKPGEHFFDRCLLIFLVNFLASHAVGKRKGKDGKNAMGAPCKVCHSLVAGVWRPALDGALICDPCYAKTNALIEKYKLHEKMEADGRIELEGVKTEGFECSQCEEEIVGEKWRGDEERGVVLCCPCFHEKYGGALAQKTAKDKAAARPATAGAVIAPDSRETSAEIDLPEASGSGSSWSKLKDRVQPNGLEELARSLTDPPQSRRESTESYATAASKSSSTAGTRKAPIMLSDFSRSRTGTPFSREESAVSADSVVG